jgi:hypothetical protein
MYSAARERAYRPARRSLTFFTVVTILLIIVTIINACVCMRNFNTGLKPHISTKRSLSGDEKDEGTEMHHQFATGGPIPSRMTID